MMRSFLRDNAWLCPIASVVFASGILLAFGLTWWDALLVVAMLACPLNMLWALVFGRFPGDVGAEAAPETEGMTIEWMASFYDRLCALFGLGRAFRKKILDVAALQPGERVLDAGCGTGLWARLAADAVGPTGQVVGVDPGPRMIGVARRNAARGENRAAFKLAAVENLPFAANSFDVALLSLVLHHLPLGEKRKGLEEVFRVLRPGGRLIVVDLDRPDSMLWRIALWPLSRARTAAAALEGNIPIYLCDAGFDPVVTDGRWRRALTFWRAMKPR